MYANLPPTPDGEPFVANNVLLEHHPLMRQADKVLCREPALLDTCREIRAETLPLYYSKYGSLSYVGAEDERPRSASWLCKIGKDGLAALRHTVWIFGVDTDIGQPRSRLVNVVVEVNIRLQQRPIDPRYRVYARMPYEDVYHHPPNGPGNWKSEA